ncbi:MAG: PilN domain-containing protein [Acidobacteria bacterium]|nr:PilN domain-containing protein [Acidobacteriota bacterium]
MIYINLLESVTDRPRGVAVVEKKVVSQGSQTILLAVVVFALLFVALGGHYFLTLRAKMNAQKELDEQQAIAVQMAAIIKEQDDLKAKTQAIEGRIDAIKALRSSQTGPGAVLRALKERIDGAPGLYLESVDQKGEQLVIKGNSPNEGTVTQFGRSLEFSFGLFSNLSIETVRKEMTFAASTNGLQPAAVPAATDATGKPLPKPETVDFTIKCAYTPGNTTTPGSNTATAPNSANQAANPASNQVAQK